MEEEKKAKLRKRIGQGLAVAREEAGKTQKDVEKCSSIIRSNRLSQVELGKTSVSAEEFVALCEFYQTTPDIVAGVRSDLPTNVYTYKINQLLAKMDSRELEIIMCLLDRYFGKTRKKL